MATFQTKCNKEHNNHIQPISRHFVIVALINVVKRRNVKRATANLFPIKRQFVSSSKKTLHHLQGHLCAKHQKQRKLSRILNIPHLHWQEIIRILSFGTFPSLWTQLQKFRSSKTLYGHYVKLKTQESRGSNTSIYASFKVSPSRRCKHERSLSAWSRDKSTYCKSTPTPCEQACLCPD